MHADQARPAAACQDFSPLCLPLPSPPSIHCMRADQARPEEERFLRQGDVSFLPPGEEHALLVVRTSRGRQPPLPGGLYGAHDQATGSGLLMRPCATCDPHHDQGA